MQQLGFIKQALMMIQIVFQDSIFVLLFTYRVSLRAEFNIPLDTQRSQFKTESFHATGSTSIDPNAQQPTKTTSTQKLRETNELAVS